MIVAGLDFIHDIGNVAAIFTHRIIESFPDIYLLAVLIDLQLAHILAADLPAEAQTVLGNHSSEAQTEIRAEGIAAQVGIDITILVELDIIIREFRTYVVQNFI